MAATEPKHEPLSLQGPTTVVTQSNMNVRFEERSTSVREDDTLRLGRVDKFIFIGASGMIQEGELPVTQLAIRNEVIEQFREGDASARRTIANNYAGCLVSEEMTNTLSNLRRLSNLDNVPGIFTRLTEDVAGRSGSGLIEQAEVFSRLYHELSTVIQLVLDLPDEKQKMYDQLMELLPRKIGRGDQLLAEGDIRNIRTIASAFGIMAMSARKLIPLLEGAVEEDRRFLGSTQNKLDLLNTNLHKV